MQMWHSYLYTLSALQQPVPKVFEQPPYRNLVLPLQSTFQSSADLPKRAVNQLAQALRAGVRFSVLQQDLPRLTRILQHRRQQQCPKTALAQRRLNATKKALKHALQLRNKLVERNLGLLGNYVKRFCSRADCGDLSRQDLHQDGARALIAAVERFDPSRGYAFSTYASWWLRAYMQEAVGRGGRSIKLPTNVEQDIRTLGGARARAYNQGKTDEDVDLPRTHIAKLDQARRLTRTQSLNEPLDEDRERGDIFGKKAGLLEHLQNKQVRQLIERQLNKLPTRERKILCRRFGLCKHEEDTLKKIGADMKLSRERVRQIEARGLQMLQKLLCRQRQTWEHMGYVVQKPPREISTKRPHPKGIGGPKRRYTKTT